MLDVKHDTYMIIIDTLNTWACLVCIKLAYMGPVPYVQRRSREIMAKLSA
jgi:hypothetical protein